MAYHSQNDSKVANLVKYREFHEVSRNGVREEIETQSKLINSECWQNQLTIEEKLTRLIKWA